MTFDDTFERGATIPISQTSPPTPKLPPMGPSEGGNLDLKKELERKRIQILELENENSDLQTVIEN